MRPICTSVCRTARAFAGFSSSLVVPPKTIRTVLSSVALHWTIHNGLDISYFYAPMIIEQSMKSMIGTRHHQQQQQTISRDKVLEEESERNDGTEIVLIGFALQQYNNSTLHVRRRT